MREAIVALLCEGSATAALQFDEGLREELEGLKVTAVTRRAIEAGVDVDAMADPKSALYTLVELILRADVEAGGSS